MRRGSRELRRISFGRRLGTAASAPYLCGMANDRERATAEFRRILIWIVVVAVLMVAGALTYLAATGELTTHLVIATVIGTFFAVLLGCGLFAAAFFSDKSGHDQSITDATRRNHDR